MSAGDRDKPIKMLLSALELSRKNLLPDWQNRFVRALARQRHDPTGEQIAVLEKIAHRERREQRRAAALKGGIALKP